MFIVIVNGELIPLSCIGTTITLSLSLFDVYYVPGLAMNLAFLGKICDSGYNVFLSV